MSESRRLLPPTSALNSFAAAARTGSFSRAGAEVGLTQSAISRQVALLEDWLQTPLFDRSGRRVALNADGRAYLEEIGPALDRIRAATRRLVERRPDHELAIATLPSFGMRWLAPRLPSLTAKHPELIVNFAARVAMFDFAEEDFDAAIHFGHPDWPGAEHLFLFAEESVPVCSPHWLRDNPVAEASDLLGKSLLVQALRRDAWTRWFADEGLGAPEVTGTSFEHFLMLAHAAAAGAGAALIPKYLIEPELESGALVILIDRPLRTDEAYYLVYPRRSAADPMLASFRSWIEAEARGATGNI